MSFKKEFDTLRELGQQTFVLRGSTLIVEILPPEELKTSGGLIMAVDTDQRKGGSIEAHKVEVGVVRMAGQGYWEESEVYRTDSGNVVSEGNYTSLECQPGSIVILPQYSIQLLSHFPGIQRPTANKLAMVKMDQILAYYPSEEAYSEAKAKLNA